jgi:predicted nucleic acid-binding Zn ribbon protein
MIFQKERKKERKKEKKAIIFLHNINGLILFFMVALPLVLY